MYNIDCYWRQTRKVRGARGLFDLPKRSFCPAMAESTRTSVSSDQGHDGVTVKRAVMTPPASNRGKRVLSLLSPFQSLSSPSAFQDASPTAEELLINTLLAIEGDDLSFDVFQFVIEIVRCEIGRFLASDANWPSSSAAHDYSALLPSDNDVNCIGSC